MEKRLLQLLVCPSCKGRLHLDSEGQTLVCNAEHLAYPVRDGVPILLADEARSTRPKPGGGPGTDPAQSAKPGSPSDAAAGPDS